MHGFGKAATGQVKERYGIINMFGTQIWKGCKKAARYTGGKPWQKLS